MKLVSPYIELAHEARVIERLSFVFHMTLVKRSRDNPRTLYKTMLIFLGLELALEKCSLLIQFISIRSGQVLKAMTRLAEFSIKFG
jgi:hypothetical protein